MARKDIKLSDKDWQRVMKVSQLQLSDENAVKAEVREVMQQLGAFDLGAPPNANFGKVSGVSDQRWLLNSYLIAIEVKFDVQRRNGPTAIQTEYLKQVQDNGGLAFVVDRNNLTIFSEIITAYAKTPMDMLAVQGYRFTNYKWCAKEIVEVTI